jgi:UDP-N-acetylglucosamine transferase subunit ALG13
LIFVTVGTQLPFDRLVQAMDAWAGAPPGKEIFIQTGGTAYQPRHCAFKPYTRPDEWEDYFRRAALVVSHAGMGTILKSLDTGKPLILMPRLTALGEHRNDHRGNNGAVPGFPNVRVISDPVEPWRHWIVPVATTHSIHRPART